MEDILNKTTTHIYAGSIKDIPKVDLKKKFKESIESK
jgi:hypothetical protein